jgi:fatty acid-binding protein DegV
MSIENNKNRQKTVVDANKIAILTDSSANFSEDEKRNYSHLYILNLIISMETETGPKKYYDFEDKNRGLETIDDQELYKALIAKKNITTAQNVNIGKFLTDNVKIGSYDYALFFPISTEISSQYNTIVSFVNNSQTYKKKIKVIATTIPSVALKVLVLNVLK